MKRLACVAVILVGCAVDPASEPRGPHDVLEQSGTRLKIAWWESSEQDLQIRGVFDTELGEDCTIQPVDGVYYCLPARPTQSLSQYARATHDVQPYDLAIVATSFCTDDGLVLPDGFHDTTRGVDCMPRQVAGADRFVCATGAIASADEPELHFELERDDTRLIRGVFTTSDGLRQHARELHDRVTVAPCTGTDGHCLPAYAEMGNATIVTDCDGTELFVLPAASRYARSGASVYLLDAGRPVSIPNPACSSNAPCTQRCVASETIGYTISSTYTLDDFVEMIPTIDP